MLIIIITVNFVYIIIIIIIIYVTTHNQWPIYSPTIQHTEYMYKTSTCFGAQVLSQGVIIQKCVGANLLIINTFWKIWLVRWTVFCFPGIIKLWLSEWLSCSSIIDRKYFCDVEKKNFFVSQPHIPAINMKEKRQIFCRIIFTCFGGFLKLT